ncbi:hypothetical protein AAG895_14140 [Thauera sp. JM12B12]|uniref:hypothetical protein n=1 Tax=Thauera sp. JM12B12 TaxID=3142262 RepID=UPI0031F3DB30
MQVLAALAQRRRWVSVYFGWRPNLPDEGDNHLFELALAAWDTENHFRALAATGDVQAALAVLDRLDAADRE